MITVFTPTYNRGYILPALYKSLQKQTSFAFEWLIVDDGSDDNTPQLVEQWLQENNKFPIHYYRTANGGKHRAINLGVQKAQYPAFFFVDSDDVLPPNSIENIINYFREIENIPLFAGVYGFKANLHSLKPLGNTYLIKKIMDIPFYKLHQKYHITGDMAEVLKTEVLKQFPFPEFEGENFISEGVVWRQISKHYILRVVPEVWYLCEYLSDGLTKNIRKKYRDNPQGSIFLLNIALKDSMSCIKDKIRCAVLYWRYLCFQKIGYKNAIWWTYLFWPFGTIIYFYDIWREKRKINK